MSETVETVRVTCPVTEGNDQGFYLINKEDFNPEAHELFEGDGPVVEEPQAEAEVEADAAPVVKPAWQQ